MNNPIECSACGEIESRPVDRYIEYEAGQYKRMWTVYECGNCHHEGQFSKRLQMLQVQAD